MEERLMDLEKQLSFQRGVSLVFMMILCALLVVFLNRNAEVTEDLPEQKMVSVESMTGEQILIDAPVSF